MTTFDLVGPVSEATRRRLADLTATSSVPADRTALALRIAHIDDLAFAKKAKLNLADLALANSLKAGFVEIADAIVTPFGFVVAGDRLIFDTQILPNGWMKGGLGGADEIIRRIFEHNFIHKLDLWRETCLLSVPAEMETLEEAFLFNSRLASFNFAHLVHDTLIQTPTYRDACADAGQEIAPLLAGPGFQYPAFGEVFRRAVGAPPVFLRGRFVRVNRLFVPTTHFAPAHDAIARGAVSRLMRTFTTTLRDVQAPERRRLFISREDSGRGDDREPRFRNGDALTAALAEIGVEPVVVSRLGVEDYLRAFVNAELVVGLHGAGIMNAILSATPRVVEITVPGYPDWRSLALFLETGMGTPFCRVVMAEPKDGLAEYDIPAVVAACRDLLATRSP